MIKPIFKTGLKNDFANYRPISILSVVGKILEKVIKIRLEGYIIKTKSLPQINMDSQLDQIPLLP
jgi:hypothetical protein